MNEVNGSSEINTSTNEVKEAGTKVECDKTKETREASVEDFKKVDSLENFTSDNLKNDASVEDFEKASFNEDKKIENLDREDATLEEFNRAGSSQGDVENRECLEEFSNKNTQREDINEIIENRSLDEFKRDELLELSKKRPEYLHALIEKRESEVHSSPNQEEIENWKYNDSENTFIANSGEELSYEKAIEEIKDDAIFLMNEIENEQNIEISSEAKKRIISDIENTLIKQLIETETRGIGEHGIKHIYGNKERSLIAYDEFMKSRNGLDSPKANEKMAILIAQIYHDDGYTLLNDGVKVKPGQDKPHDVISGELFKDNKAELFNEVLDKDTINRIIKSIETHNSDKPNEIYKNCNFKEDPVIAAVHVSDKIAISEREKFAPILENPNIRELMQKVDYVRSTKDSFTKEELEDYNRLLCSRICDIVDTDDKLKYLEEDIKERFKKAAERDISIGGTSFSLPMSVIDTRPDCITFDENGNIDINIGVLKNKETTEQFRIDYAKQLEDDGTYTRQVEKILEDFGLPKNEIKELIENEVISEDDQKTIKKEIPTRVVIPQYNEEELKRISLGEKIPPEEVKNKITISFTEMKFDEKDERFDTLKTIVETDKSVEKVWIEEKYPLLQKELLNETNKKIMDRIEDGSIENDDVAKLLNTLLINVEDSETEEKINHLLTETCICKDKKECAEKALNLYKDLYAKSAKEYLNEVMK